MKKIIYFLFMISGSVLFLSCEKEYEDHITKVTPAPVMELIGGDPIVLYQGTPYTDPGIHAMEIIGEDTTELTYEVINEVFVDVPGTYRLYYKVVNSENIPFYISRRVNIVNFTGYDVFEFPSGTYDGIRINRNLGGPVQINKLAPGVYQISDLFGGYYEFGAGYGSEYAAPAILVISADGTVRSELGAAPWGEVVGSNFTYDPVNKIILYKVTIPSASFSFDVKLTLK